MHDLQRFPRARRGIRIVSTDRVVAEPVGLSLDIQTLTVEPDGLVIVAGPRGSDKHTVIHALVELISRTRKAYVIHVSASRAFRQASTDRS